MTGHMHTDLPSDVRGHRGERALAEQLCSLADARTHLWFGVDYLPSVADIDLLIAHVEIGVFNVEVKAVSLDMIEDYGLDRCAIRGRGRDDHPVKQAGLAQLDLRNYLAGVMAARTPFFHATAAFPKVSRSGFLERFGNGPIARQAQGMLFAEDLSSQANLLTRLQEIRQSPPRGRPARNPQPKPDQLSGLIEALDGGTVPAASEADRHRGSVLLQQVGRPGRQPEKSLWTKYLEPGGRAPVVFRGKPGTGKTVGLQEIAVAHARHGRTVLFTCFNKVLASTLRTIMSTQDLGEDVRKRVLVVHVDELRKQLEGDEVEPFRGLFSTICVDEAQDMAQESFEFLQEIASESAEWFLADGPGQELYGAPSPFVEDARKNGTIQQLRRNFRNSAVGYLFSQAVHDHAPDIDRIPNWVAERPLPVDDQISGQADGLFALDVEAKPGGELPKVTRLDVPHGGNWRQAKLDGLIGCVHGELEKLAAEGRPRDLAVLFARSDESKTAEPQIVREALQMLRVPFHDQIDPANRGAGVPEGHVRLASIHSARGVEASRVVLLDLDKGLSRREDHRANSRIMAHIALSRAQVGTHIVVLDDADNPYVQFIEELIRAYRASAAG